MATSNSIKPLLDQMEKPLAAFLKSEGFKKIGRTFNREAEKGIIQVINLQSGTFPIGSNYNIPGFRESKYGQFTVNIGTGVEEVYKVHYPNTPIKTGWKEYDCVVRARLGTLLYGKDYWWGITSKTEKAANDIIEGFKNKGIPWLGLFDSREKICQNFNESLSPRAELDIALIVFFQNNEKGTRLLQKYYNNIGDHNPHQDYVFDLAKSLGVALQKVQRQSSISSV